MGRESIDFNGGMVHGMVGELLAMPSFSPVMKLELDGTMVKMAREIEGGKEILEASLPLIAGCQEPIAEWKIPNMRGIMSARTKPLIVVEPVSQETQAEAGNYLLPPAKGAVKLIDKDNVKVYIEQTEGKVKKTSLEAVSFANALAAKTGEGDVVAVALGTLAESELSGIGAAGAAKVLHVTDPRLNEGVIQAHASAVSQAFHKVGAKTLVLAKSSLGDSVAARLSIKLGAGLVSNVVELPNTSSGYSVKRSIFTGKAFAETSVSTENKILAVKKNAIELKTDGSPAMVEKF